jgi:hypothetical protein
MECNICNKQTDYLETHHIVPKSRGGLDTKGNLIDICIECHNLAHDVSFKRTKGLISEGVLRSQKKSKEDSKWCDENQELIEKKFTDIWDEDEYKAQFISYSFKCCNWTGTTIKDFVLYDKLSLKCSINN